MDERRAERLSSDTQVFTFARGNRLAHECRNISRLGCMIAMDGLDAATGDDLEVELVDGVVIPARVIWARQGYLGLSFKREINPATVRHLAEADQVPASLQSKKGVGRLLPERFATRAA